MTLTERIVSGSLAHGTVGRVDWPLIPPEAVALANRLAVPREALQLSVLGETARMAFGPRERSATPRGLLFALGTQVGRLDLSETLVETLAAKAGLTASPMSEAPLCRALLLEWMLLGFAQAIEGATGETVRILPDDPHAHVFDHSLSGSLTFGGGGDDAAFRLDLPASLAERLAEARGRLSPILGADLGAVPIPLAIVAGHQRLTLAELADLRAGDVVMLAEARPKLDVGGRLSADLERAPHGYRLATALRAPRTAAQEDVFMNDVPADDEGLEAVPIGLVFELGRLELPLAQLRTLGPGSVVPLDRADEELVEILANGRRIGRGSLVRIGEGLGLRILNLATHG